MNRCPESRPQLAHAIVAALLVLFSLLAAMAHAQGIRREVPRDVVPGRIAVKAPPLITVDGKPDRLSPGARIHDINNMLVLPASVAGKEAPVLYRREASTGLVHEAWILSDSEYAKLQGLSPAGSTAQDFARALALIFGARP